MIINPSLPFGYSIFCDDVRFEIGNKRTYVGVYGSTMILKGISPFLINQIAVSITFRVDLNRVPLSGFIRIFKSDSDDMLFEEEFSFPDKIDTPISEIAGNEKNSPIHARHNTVAFLKNVEISKPCFLRVRAFFGGNEVRLGALAVTFDPVEN